MPDPLIRTKLHLPFIRPNLVPRPQLQARIIEGLFYPLTLVVAPAGFGKTTLVAASLTGCRLPVAWLSLDRSDNQADQFLKYLIAALQSVDNQMGNEAVQLMGGMQQTSPQAVLTSLINDLDSLAKEVVLVLDDYQFINSQVIHEQVAFIIDHCPGSFHLVIATRSDPPLPITRLRARAQMIELRTDELRFTVPESSQFLNDVMGLSLDIGPVEKLGERTEGWVAGLQMAALSMRGRQDIDQFIAGFSGTNRYILEYLSDEVLSRQSEDVRSFLLHTSILERLCGGLCDAVIGEPCNSQEKLDRLDKANLFLIPLDEEHHWYRYHHLFADLLRTRLQQTINPQGIAQLHLRAADWFEQQGSVYEAIHHASLTADEERVERLIERNYNDRFRFTERASFRYLTGKLSKELVYKRPWLCIYKAESDLWFGQQDEAEVLLAQAEKHLQGETTDPEIQAMQGHHDYVKARIMAMRGDFHQAIELGHRAHLNTPLDNLALQLNIAVLLGYAYFLDGKFDQAAQILSDTINSAPNARDVTVAMCCVLARLYTVQGLLKKSHDLYQESLQAIHAASVKQLGAISILNVGIAKILYEWNELSAARTQLNQGLAFIQYWGKADDIALAYATLAQIDHAQGNFPAAVEAIEKGAQATRSNAVFEEAREAVMSTRVRFDLAQGDQSAIAAWLNSLDAPLIAGDSLRFGNELTYITLSRVYLAQKKWHECLVLLSRLEENAQSGGRMGRLIQILILKALVMQKLGDPQAFATLERCLAIAEPQGYSRTFLDEGQPMQLLLALWLSRASSSPLRNYAVHLLSQFDAEIHPVPEKASPSNDLVEPLSQRELEVLHLLALGKTNQEIAEQLVVAPGTVKAHTARIYRKLDAANRTEAVARARQLKLLP